MNSDPAANCRWLSAVHGRRLVHWRGSDLAMVVLRLQDACAKWAADWGVRPGGVVTCVAASAQDWALVGFASEGRVPAVAWRLGACTKRISELLFAEEVAPGGVAADVIAACERDAWLGVESALELDACSAGARAAPAPGGRKWDGAVVATLPFGGRLLLAADAVDALTRRGSVRSPARASKGKVPLVSVEEAVENTPYAIDVELEGCEMDLGAFRELQVGDVLRIRHALDAPASVRSAAGVPLFSAVLARSRGRKAVELATCAIQPSLQGKP
jgi:hypothetical protein